MFDGNAETLQEQNNFIYNLSLHLYEEWADGLHKDDETAKLLEMYSESASLPKNSTACMMFASFVGGLSKAFEMVNKLEREKETD